MSSKETDSTQKTFDILDLRGPGPTPDGLSLLGVGCDLPQTGNFTENVNLDRDFVRAFGDMPKVLVGLAVTADSDDTDGKILAAIQDLQIR